MRSQILTKYHFCGILYFVIEPIFRPENEAALPQIGDTSPEAMLLARDRALLWRATNLAIESAFRFGKDLPVGAVIAGGEWIVGRYFASDQRNELRPMHAEYMAVTDAYFNRDFAPPVDTVVVTVEPCDNCQDYLASQPGIKRVGFSMARQQVAELGLVKPHDETIFQRALRVGLPYEVIQIDDEQLREANRTVLSHVSRDVDTGQVQVDRIGLHEDLVKLNAA